MTIKSKLTPAQRKIINELKADDSIIICPADKGKAIVMEDCENYLLKMQDQLDKGDFELNDSKEKTLLDKLHKKQEINNSAQNYGH